MRGALNEMDRHDGDRVLAENRLKHEAARMSKVSSWPINPYSQALNRVESWKQGVVASSKQPLWAMMP